MKLDKHRPPHLYKNNQIYFLTIRCFNKNPYFKNKKDLVKKIINKTIIEFRFKLFAWVVLDNHLHILFEISENFKKFIQIFNGRISYEIGRTERGLKSASPACHFSNTGENFFKTNGLADFVEREKGLADFSLRYQSQAKACYSAEKEKVLQQYWDYCIRNEIDFWKHFNYIHNNPIKHRYIGNLEELGEYQFSSYNNWVEKKGKNWLMDCFGGYPIIDYSDDE